MKLRTAIKLAKLGHKVLIKKKKRKSTAKTKRSGLRFKTKLGITAAAVGTAAVGVGAAAVLTHENKALTVATHTVPCKGLPSAFDGMRLVHLSDLHAASFGKNNARLLSLIDSLDADMVVITGDLIDRRRTTSVKKLVPVLSLMQQLQKRLPTVRVDGNHEAMAAIGPQFRKIADKTGVQNLTGRSLTVTRGNETVELIGIPDIAAVNYDDEVWQQTLHELCDAHKDRFRIVLSHRPQYFPAYAAEELPLVLCGHAHGGQVRLPMVGGLYAPEQGVLPKYTAGKYAQHGTTMVVSRGLGNSGFPFRFGNRPEVGVIVLKAE